MALVVYEFRDVVTDAETSYAVEAWGDRREDGRWEGWLVFISADGVLLVTEPETFQASLDGLRSWAAALGPPQLRAALRRARPADDRAA